MEIRKATNRDAEDIIFVMSNAEESGFMLFAPGERKVTPESLGKLIELINSQTKSGMFIATEGDRILGYMIVQNEKPQRIAHRAYIVIGVHSDSRGKGVGNALFTSVISWAKQVELHRLELTVIATNEVAVHLYKKMGFEIEGVKKDSLFIDGQYVDEYYMSRLL
ncbi:GNAT family N-acetyltransferase [Solibacillus sp. R5-41]|uniref:GNAT family N-acetyltransferase n=1 Tax=Solibacillus sp. R5-41 TaxID=2048654 RepID=UPI001562AB58|nr:GNAT family N-acetyltransferase [Solibacillus sp. R5-41]